MNAPDPDIEALALLVLMEATRSAQEDLQAIMNGVKDLTKDEILGHLAARIDVQAAILQELSTFEQRYGQIRATLARRQPQAAKQHHPDTTGQRRCFALTLAITSALIGGVLIELANLFVPPLLHHYQLMRSVSGPPAARLVAGTRRRRC
jgi:hypothetical protein